MKLRIGDKVRFLNETGEGVVTRIKDNKTVFVEMQDGFEIPYLVNQLVPIHTELILNKDADNIELNPNAHLTDAIYFVIEPDHDYFPLVSDFKIYLFNASSFNLLYTYAIKEGEYYQAIKRGEAGPYQKVLLKQVKIQFFNEYTQHKIDCLLFKNTFYKLQPPLSHAVYVSAKLLKESTPIKHNEFKFPVFGFLLKDEFFVTENITEELSPSDIERLKNVKEFEPPQKISKSIKEQLKALEKEIDLHIEELVENPGNLSNFEKLSLQMKRFEKELYSAIASNIKKLIIIHGVGNGRLRHEIHAALKKTEGVTFHDAPFKDYGYGATQVNIP